VLRAVEHDRKPDRALCIDAGVFDLTGCGLLRELDDAAYPGVLPRRATRCVNLAVGAAADPRGAG
jgi:hypothetical protein